MATLDNVNLFAVGDATDDTQDPLYPEYLELVKRFEELKQGPTIPGGYPDAPSFASFKKDKQNQLARQTLATELEAGNIKKAYEEGFTQLPIGEQLLYYINPVTGVPIETYETGYFTKEGGLGIKTPREMLVDAIDPRKNIFQKSFLKADDPVSAGIAPLSAIGALGGVFELANIPKAGLMALRRFQQKTMDGGGGGIGGLPEPEPQPTFDDAGYKSNVLEEAKAVEIDSGQALLDYLTSPKRQNPSNNKGGTALKKSEIDEIDFDKFKAENPGDFTKEQLLQYIDDNRVKLYRVRRAEENPDIRTDDAFASSEDVDFYLDEPLTNQIYGERLMANYDDMFNTIEEQKVFFNRNFGPEGIITKETYQKYLDKPESGTQQNARKVFMNQIEADSLNPFFELEEPEFVFIRPDGTIDEDMSLVQSGLGIPQSMSYIEDALNQGFTVKPKVLDKNFDVDNLADQASQRKTEFESEQGLIDEAYRYVGDDDIFEIIGNTEDGYSVRLNGEFDYDNFDENMSFNEAELQVRQYIDREYEGNLGDIDNPAEPDDLINLVPEGVIKENQSLPTKYGEQYSDFRLPMGGATDYEEYTIHIKNPKTTTRYKLGTRDEPKHFGGGDELFHLRTTLRTDENGKKVLFVEEIQSDLHSTARSTQSDATYELPPKERQKIEKQLEQEFGLTSNATQGNRGFGNFFYRGEPGTGGEKMMDIGALPSLAAEIRLGRTSQFGSKNADDFVNTFGLEKTQEIGDLVTKLQTGNLPDFPYKKDWVDMAVKEAMKIGVEKGADRVAFVNAPTQIARNNKNLIYVQDRIITKMPTKEELINTPEFKSTYEQNLTLRYEDYVNNSHDTNQPIPTQEEFYASIPKARKRIKEINKESSKIAQEMKLKYLDDVRKFKQQYPDSPFVEEDFGGLTPSGFEFERAYRDLADAEIQILSKRMNDAFDITSDPRNVDITNPALARMLDADLDFREIPAEINDKFTEIKKLSVEKDYLDSIAYRDKEQMKEVTQRQLINDLQLNRPFRVEDVGYVVEGDEILNPQRTQLVGDDYDEQRINFRRLTNEDELLEEIPEKFREQVKKDLAAGKKEITLNIDDLEGSGKKFLEIYKNEIPRGINKVLKDLKVKDVKPDINRVLFAADDPFSDLDNLSPKDVYREFLSADIDARTGVTAPSKTSVGDDRFVGEDFVVGGHSSIGIDLTDEMKRKIIQEGLSSMYMGGKVTKSKSMDRPIEGNRREM